MNDVWLQEGSSTVVHLISQASVPGTDRGRGTENGGEQSAAVRENE